MIDEQGTDAAFEALRGRLFGIAYRMLGSRAEAEDVVQDTYVRWHQAAQDAVRSPEAWLVTAATRRAIDRLRALKAEREAYVGPWLPEPLIGDDGPRPDQAMEVESDLSIAFLALLERLAPEERAAFLLHDVFDCDYRDIARILEKTETASRQVVHRARERVRRDRKRFHASEDARVSLLKRFTAAVEARDEQALLSLFAPDATWTADSGGRVPASPRPIVGADRIARLVVGLTKRFLGGNATLRLATVNGETGLFHQVDGQLKSVIAVETDGERIVSVSVIVNPDKLGRAAAH
jgi:RNA polymerase sigma-70 factor (ECF subfamily)